MNASKAIVRVIGGILLVLATARGAVAGGTYCFQSGPRTYCDDGRAYYRYGNDIVSKDGRRWHTFGSHTYGGDGSWIARHGKGRSTSSYRSGPGDEAAILPRILDDAADRDAGGDDGEGEGADD